ncbi:MAG: translocation/assembly module TamB domain-containing protein [Deltaproteobacteria bacterium]|nr:translocation/assembly module TamB domain-containing protein [Deltaproteobacteria bacterium]
MKWLRLSLLLVVAATLIAAVALRERLLVGATEALRGLIEREASAALEAPLRVGTLHLTFVPPGLTADAVTLGEDGTIGSVRHVSAWLLLRTSLRQRRPVVEAEIDTVRLDLPALLDALPPPQDDAAVVLPAFRLRRVHGRDVHVRVTPDPHPMTAEASEVVGQVSAGRTGRLRFAGQALGARVERAGRTLSLSELAARGAETRRGWRLTGLTLRADGVELYGTPGTGALTLNGTLALPRLAFVADELADLHGTATISGSLEGALDAPQVHATVQVPSLAIGARELGELAATATVDRHQVQLASARLRGFAGAAEASGTLTLDEALTYSGRATWSGIDTRRAGALLPADLPGLASDGSVALAGTLEPLRVAVKGDGRFTPAGAAPITWRGGADYAAQDWQVDVELAQGAGNRAAVQARVEPGQRLGGTARVQVADPDALRGVLPIASLPNVRGNASASARLSGTLGAPQVDGELSARDLLYRGVRVDRVDGRFGADRQRLHTDGIIAAIGGGEATLRGTVALDPAVDNAWSVHAARIDGALVTALARELGGVSLPIAGGTLTADATASGPWSRIRLGGGAALQKFWLGRERIERAALTLQASGGRWVADATIGNRADQLLTAHGEGAIGGAISATANGDWTLTSLQQGEQAEMGGAIHLTAALRGQPAGLDGTAELRTDGLVLGGRPIGAVRLAAQAVRGRWTADLTMLDGSFTARGEVRPAPGMPFSVDGAWRDADLAHLISDKSEARIDSSGTVQVRGRLDDARNAEINVDVPVLRIIQGERTLAAQAPLRLSCRRGLCTLAPLTWSGGSGNLTIGGEAGFDGRLRLTMDGEGSVGLLELLGDPIESATGRFRVNALVLNGPGGLRTSGTLTLERAGIDAGLPVSVTRTDGRLTLDGTRIRIDQLDGRIGTGTYRIGGVIDLVNGPDVTWQLTDVGAVAAPSLEVEVSGKGTIDGSWDAPRLAGEVLIHRMLYDRDINLVDFLPSFNRALARAPRPPGARELLLDLRIHAPAQLFVENNVARIEGRADLRLTGTANRPVVSGRVEALDGTITFRSREFELQGATADFRPEMGMVAAINASAESVIETRDATYTVGIQVTGTTENPRVTLSSDDPSLSQTDIATLITVGRTASQMRSAGGGFSAWDALGFVPHELTGAVEGPAKQFLPIDRIEFESVYSRTTGNFEPQIKIGKDLSDNLAVSVGQTFGISSRTSVEAEYRLGPRVSIPLLWESQTETEAGAFGGGVRVRYEFWRVTPFTLLGGQ